MATISGKRFQITDGANTPTNLFPYTVTEAVYGLSTVIENAKTAVTSVLSAVTLNGVSKAGTTASFYAPTTAGTTGQILKATTSGAPVWTSAALGASNKPIYLNSSGVLTEGVACLPLTGGTIKNGNAGTPLTLDTTSGTIGIYFATSATSKAWVGYQPTYGSVIYSQASSKYLGIKDDGTPHYQGNTLWHAGNSNLNTVDWTAKKLFLSLQAPSTTTTSSAGINLFYGPSSGWETSEYPYAYSEGISIGYVTSLQLSWLRSAGGMANLCGRIIDSAGKGSWTTIYNATNANKSDVAWTCSTLTANSEVIAPTITAKSDTYPAVTFADSTQARWIFSKRSTASDLHLIRYTSSQTYDTVMAFAYSSGNVGIGTTSPSQKLHVVGAILSTGDQVVSSDLTLKTNLTPVTYSVSDIASARAVEFDWKDGRGHSMGSIAQDWLSIAPALVHGKEGNMSLAYGQLALVNTILEARAIESLQVHESEQDKEIRELRERVARLEMENERLRMN